MQQAVVISGTESVAVSTGAGLASVVGFFFAFRLFIMLLSVWVLGTDPQTGVEISLIGNFSVLAAVAFACLGEGRRGESDTFKRPAVCWALFFLAFSGSSLFWSSAVSLAAAAAFWGAMGADCAIVLLLLRSKPAAEIAPALMKGYVCGASLIAIIAWFMPAQPDLRLGYADLLGPNQIGYLCGFAFFFAQYLARDKRGIWTAAMVLLGITLLRSLSKTTIVAMLVSQSFVLMHDRSISRRTKVLTGLGALLAVLIFWNLFSSYYDVYTNAGNQSETLTGRVGLWLIFLSEAVQQPWIGHGFHSVWKVIPPFGPEQFEARHAHNELLQQFYAYGVVGVVMLIGLYGSFLRQIRRMARSPLRTFFLSLLLFVAIRGVADTEPFDLSLPLWAILLFTMLVHGIQTTHQKSFVLVPSPQSRSGIPKQSNNAAILAE